MTIEIRLTGADKEHAVSDAVVLLREIGACEPECQVIESDDGIKRDPATVIAIATLVVSLPGAVVTADAKARVFAAVDQIVAF